MPEIKIDVNDNVIYLGAAGFEANGHRMIVLQDEYRSGFECLKCNALGEIECNNCKGSGTSLVVKDAKCSACNGRGKSVCPECKGQGATMFVPETAQSRPTTGTIVSIGPDVTRFERGDRVLYMSFAGHAFDLTAKTLDDREIMRTIVVLVENDILCRMYGELDQRSKRAAMALNTLA